MASSMAEIRGSWSEEKQAFNRQFPWNYWVSRQLSFYVAWLFLRAGITANQATWISLGVGLAAALGFATGAQAGFVAGALLYNLFLVLDAVDGNIARVRGSASREGRFYDIATGLVVEASFFFSIGAGLLRAPEVLPAWISPEAAGLLAVATCVLLLLSSLMELRFAQVFEAEPEAGPAPARSPLLRLVWLNLLRFNGIRLPWLLVAVLTATLHWYVLFYFAMSSLDLARCLARSIHRVRAADPVTR